MSVKSISIKETSHDCSRSVYTNFFPYELISCCHMLLLPGGGRGEELIVGGGGEGEP